MLNQIKQYLPRNTGMCWNLQKFHDLTHLPDDIARFGSPQNTDAGPGERSLKYFAKEMASTSQKCEGKFLGQVAARLHERATISRAKRLTDPSHEWDEEISFGTRNTNGSTLISDEADVLDDGRSWTLSSSFARCSTRYELKFSSTGTYVGTRRNGKGQTLMPIEVHPLVIQWFINDQQERKHNQCVHCWTDYQRDGINFRALPNFRSKGPWYDWAEILFDSDDSTGNNNQGGMYFPSKILCFYKDPTTLEKCALVHSCNEKEEEDYAPICDEWFLEYQESAISIPPSSPSSSKLSRCRKERHFFPDLRSVSVDSFGSPLFVIQEVPGLHESFPCKGTSSFFNRCIVVKNREHFWGSEFC